MPVRKSNAVWEGNLQNGSGKMRLGSGYFEGNYSFSSRFENGEGTNPEELIGAAHAGCFSMALAHALAGADFKPEKIETQANVNLIKGEAGFKINNIELVVNAQVPDIAEDKFLKFAEDAKNNCPVSQALTGTKITLQATLNK